MSEATIERLFHEDRFSNATWKVIFLLLYSPIGITIAMIRMFMVLQAFAAASLLRPQVAIRRFILRVVCCALGIVFEEDESECKRNESVRFLVANHVSIFDYIPIHLCSNCITPVNYDISDWLLYGIGLKNISTKTSNSNDVRLTLLRSEMNKRNCPILLFPEETTTKGTAGLLKFSHWWASEVNSVQPIALYLKRPSLIDIKPTVLGSSSYSDYFWSFFVPFTIYTVKYLPVIEKESDECDEKFADRIQAAIANSMGVTATKFTHFDKVEYEKRYLKDKHRAFLLNQQNMLIKSHRDLQKMMRQVSEVLPHVPQDIILKDLKKTGNVDVTITNILEEKIIIPYRNETNENIRLEEMPGPSSSMSVKTNVVSKSNVKPLMSFQERKAKLLEDARKRYKEKHSLL